MIVVPGARAAAGTARTRLYLIIRCRDARDAQAQVSRQVVLKSNAAACSRSAVAAVAAVAGVGVGTGLSAARPAGAGRGSVAIELGGSRGESLYRQAVIDVGQAAALNGA